MDASGVTDSTLASELVGYFLFRGWLLPLPSPLRSLPRMFARVWRSCSAFAALDDRLELGEPFGEPELMGMYTGSSLPWVPTLRVGTLAEAATMC